MRIIYNTVSALDFEDEENRKIVECLYENDANILNTAHELGISRNRLYIKIRKYKLWPIIFHLRKERRQRVALQKKGIII